MSDSEDYYMGKAIRLSLESIKKGGGPFGAVIVKDGVEIASGSNSVVLDTDPTAHAEITAIRNAAQKLGTYDLSGCVIYTSCEPCPMCLSAIYWAHIEKIYYANTRNDALKIGFDDSYIYDQLKLDENKRDIPVIRILKREALDVFQYWDEKKDKVKY